MENKIGRYVYDIESDGLYNQFTKIHCIRAYDLDSQQMFRFDEFTEPIFKGIKLLNNAKELIGHNIIGFDNPALRKYSKKFTNWKHFHANSFDTIVASKLVCTGIEKQDLGRVKADTLPSRLIGSHSLEAWGYRLGENKGEYGKRIKGESDEDYMDRVWARGSQEMYDYCEQDVMTNVKLYWHIQEQIIKRETPIEAIDIEFAFATLISRQERHGVLLDVTKADKLESTLRLEASGALDTLLESYLPKWFVGTPDKTRMKWCNMGAVHSEDNLSIIKDCLISHDEGIRYYSHSNKAQYKSSQGILYHKVATSKSNRRKKVNCPLTGIEVMTTNTIKDSQWSNLELKEFNPNSSSHVIRWLKDLYGWEPSEFTDKGNPKADGDTLGALTYDGIDVLQNYQMLLKRLGQLADGKSALLGKYVQGTNRIHGRCDTLGAVTRRCTHSNPNLAQIPANRAPYGKEFRELFTVPKGYKMVGADGSGLELRTLAHYLYLFDEGAYAEVVLNGDIHTKNQLDAGLDTRDDAKTFIYAFLYGAGTEKLGEIVLPNGTAKEKKSIGTKLKNKFMKANPPVKQLIHAIKDRASERKFVYDLDGNKLFIRSEHSAPNLLLQSCGAIVMKYWAVEVDRILQEMGFENSDDIIHTDRQHDYENVLNIHDESQLEVKDEIAQQVADVMQSTFSTVGLELKMNIKIDGEAKIGSSWKETH